jgi:hypothetical protein
MTPEEIVTDLLVYGIRDYQPDTLSNKKEQAIEAIKQYAKDMCDKQRYNCNENVEVETIDSHGQDTCYVNSDSVLNAPYPSELL